MSIKDFALADIIMTQSHLNYPAFDLDNYDRAWLNNTILNPELIQHYCVIPLEKKNDYLKLGMINPTDQHVIDAITFHTGLRVIPTVIAEDQLRQFIETHYGETLSEKNLKVSLLKNIPWDDNSLIIQENTVNYDEPLIQFVDNMIQHALQQSASDIHIEPYASVCRIRYRCDGLLVEMADIPIQLASRLVTRLKVLAKMDITERRLPQDGRFPFQAIDIRINTCPTLFGEKIVLRLLDFNKTSLDVDGLGFNDLQKKLFIKKISEPHGMILVTGPTGSGKTVTLYSALHYLNSIEKNISTVEDPVEIQLNGINQVNINPKIGLDFSTVLRTFLRQDPDIIMVGEIRDRETANIAIQAASTGHLVLSTLHTNSAAEAIIRLQSMQIAPYNITSSISLIIAQRLIRKLCPRCKEPEKNIGFRAAGCKACIHGYQGRIGIYEFFLLTEKITQLILSQATLATIIQQAEEDGFQSLYQAGLEKISEGITSIAEVNRVIRQ